MIFFYNSLIRRCNAAAVNKFQRVILNNIRLLATESTAVQIRPVRRKPRTQYDVGGMVLLIIPVSSFGLGTWQVFRMREKTKINDALLEKTKQPTVDLPKNLEELKEMEFCTVRVKGRFDHSKELYMGPRPFISEDSLKTSLSLLSSTKAGFMVITPFVLSDRNLTILVNRGWVPAKQKLPNTRSQGQISEEVEFVGLVRSNEIRKPLGAKNNVEKGFWVYRDVKKMAELTGAAPVFIDADRASTVPGGPLGGQTLVKFANDHFSYMVTWFSLSGVSSYLWYLRYLSRLPIPV